MLKHKLMVSTHSSKLDSPVSILNMFEFRDARIGSQGLSLEDQDESDCHLFWSGTVHVTSHY